MQLSMSEFISTSRARRGTGVAGISLFQSSGFLFTLKPRRMPGPGSIRDLRPPTPIRNRYNLFSQNYGYMERNGRVARIPGVLHFLGQEDKELSRKQDYIIRLAFSKMDSSDSVTKLFA